MMGNLRGEPVHGECITDGDASAGIPVVLYEPGNFTAAGIAVVRELTADEILYVTDVQILCETGGDIFLCADGKVAGEYVAHGALDAKGGIILHFEQPRGGAPGTGLKLFGAATNINSCIIEGFITQG